MMTPPAPTTTPPTTPDDRRRPRSVRAPALSGLLLLVLLLGLLVGCHAAPVTDVRERTARVAVLPVVNLSGRDLQSVPEIFWESSGTQRVLTRIMRTRVFLEQLPFPADALARARAADPTGPLQQLAYDENVHELVWAEVMAADDRQALLALAPDDSAWQAAVNELYRKAQRHTVNIATGMRLAVVRHLRTLGFTVTDLGDEMAATDEAPSTTGHDAGYRERIRQAAAATRATGVLSVAIEEWDWTRIFETRELKVSLTAVLADPTDGTPIWNRSTGTIVCKVPDALVVGGSINLGKAYGDYLVQLASRLFD